MAAFAPMRWGSRLGSGFLLVPLAIVLALATGLIDARGSSARARWHGGHTSSAQAVLSLTVSDSFTGRPIPAGFLGFSFEYPTVEKYAGFDPKAVNRVLVQLIRNLTPGQRPVLRIGGDTTDWTWWPVPGVGNPGGIRYSLDSRFAQVTTALAHELNARLILGINLEADSATVAATEARELVARIGRGSIEALELGNEPELYASFSWYTTRGGIHVPGRPKGYDFAAYQGDYARISAALPDVPLAGPASGTSNWIAHVGAFLPAEPRVRLATVHRYPLQRCYLPAASAMYPSIAHLLSPAASQGLADSVARSSRPPTRDGWRSASTRSTRSPAAAPRASATSSPPRCGRSTPHSRWPGSASTASTSTPSRARATSCSTSSAGTGAGTDSWPPSTTASRCLPKPRRLARACCACRVRSATSGRGRPVPRAATIHIVLINEYTTRSPTVAVRIAGARGSAMLERLRAPGIAARSGVTLGGETFGTATTTGVLQGRFTGATVARRRAHTWCNCPSRAPRC